jgi:hypothetical protein
MYAGVQMYGPQRADGRSPGGVASINKSSPGGVASSQQKQISWGVSLLSNVEEKV